jgi:hypothetical protein
LQELCMVRCCLFLTLTLAPTLAAGAAAPAVHKLWPGKAPGETKDLGPEKLTEPKGPTDVKRLGNVSEPTITVFAPPKEKANGTAVVVAPGGGYSILAIEHEGTDVCKWLNDLGVTAVLLKYRVPKRPGQTPDNLAMVQDAQRAVTLVRGMSKELGIDPKRVGMLGFSAGGHLTACTALTKKRLFDPVEPADGSSPRAELRAADLPRVPHRQGRRAEAGVRGDGRFAADVLRALHRRPGDERGERSPVPGADEGEGAGRTAPVRVRRARVRDAQDPHPCATWPDRAGDWLKSRGLLEKGK